jgi:hypothetical protein
MDGREERKSFYGVQKREGSKKWARLTAAK